MKIDGVLDGEAVGRTRPVQAGIGVAGNHSGAFGNKVREALRRERRRGAARFLPQWADDFECRGAVENVVRVDLRDSGDVRLESMAGPYYRT